MTLKKLRFARMGLRTIGFKKKKVAVQKLPKYGPAIHNIKEILADQAVNKIARCTYMLYSYNARDMLSRTHQTLQINLFYKNGKSATSTLRKFRTAKGLKTRKGPVSYTRTPKLVRRFYETGLLNLICMHLLYNKELEPSICDFSKNKYFSY